MGDDTWGDLLGVVDRCVAASIIDEAVDQFVAELLGELVLWGYGLRVKWGNKALRVQVCSGGSALIGAAPL